MFFSILEIVFFATELLRSHYNAGQICNACPNTFILISHLGALPTEALRGRSACEPVSPKVSVRHTQQGESFTLSSAPIAGLKPSQPPFYCRPFRAKHQPQHKTLVRKRLAQRLPFSHRRIVSTTFHLQPLWSSHLSEGYWLHLSSFVSKSEVRF